MGNEYEKINKDLDNVNLESPQHPLKRSRTDIGDEFIQLKNINNSDKEISRMLFDDEPKIDNEKKSQKENEKNDKKPQLKSYADEYAEEQFIEEINRSKSLNKEIQRRNLQLENDKKNLEKKIDKDNKQNNIKIEVNNDIKTENIKEKEKIYLNTERNKDIYSNEKNYEKIKPKSKTKNFLKRLFTPIKKLKRFRHEDNKKLDNSHNISSPANNLNLKKTISNKLPNTKVFTGEMIKNDTKPNENIIKKQSKEESLSKERNDKGYMSEGGVPKSKKISSDGKKYVLTKDIYDKIDKEDLKDVLAHLKNSNNKYQEGINLYENKNYNEAKNCFYQARESFMNLNKLINNNPKAYPDKFRIVISLKINEKMRETLNRIKECNTFMMKTKSERNSKSQGKSFSKLNFNFFNRKKSKNSKDLKDIKNDLNNKNKNITNNNNNLNGIKKNNINNFNNNKDNKNALNNAKKINNNNIIKKNNKFNNHINHLNIFKNNLKIIKDKGSNQNNISNNNISKNNCEEKDEIDEKISSEIMIKNPGVQFNDIIGMQELKKTLHEIIVIPTIRPDLFTGIRNPQRGILLFGPPGTGKTMIAKAIASECKSTFFNISASSLTSKWLGESEKMVKSLFKLAYKKSPSIIFIDEIDSILSKRNENENESTKRLKTEFLIQFDGLNTNKNMNLLVIAATNRPMDLDEALLRRLPKRIYCGPLDEEGRFEFIKKTINKVENNLTDDDIKEVSKLTEGYSNSDLKELCKEAAFQPVRELNIEEILKIEKFRPLIKNDLIKSVNKVRGSLSTKIINELLEWNKAFGGI